MLSVYLINVGFGFVFSNFNHSVVQLKLNPYSKVQMSFHKFQVAIIKFSGEKRVYNCILDLILERGKRENNGKTKTRFKELFELRILYTDF